MPNPLLRDKAAIRVAIVSGALNFEEASKQLGIKVGTLRSWACRERWFDGLKEPRNGSDSLQCAAMGVAECPKSVNKQEIIAKDGQNVAVAATESLASLRDRIRSAGSRASAKGLEHIASQDADYVIQKADKMKLLADVGAKCAGFDTDERNHTVVNIGFLNEGREAIEISDEGTPLLDG